MRVCEGPPKGRTRDARGRARRLLPLLSNARTGCIAWKSAPAKRAGMPRALGRCTQLAEPGVAVRLELARLAVHGVREGRGSPGGRRSSAGLAVRASAFSSGIDMNRAKSTRRVLLLSRIGSPTCRLQTGRLWLSPSSRSLPRRRSSVCRWRTSAGTPPHGRRGRRSERAARVGPTIVTSALSFQKNSSWPSRVMCHPHESTRRAPGGEWSSTAWAVPDE